ncbi:MAG: response regulator [Gemmatimonadetes bacterium]|nr:response regulator [Gemmatimonadota bacterium]
MFPSDPTLLVIEDARVDAMLIRVAARRSVPGLDVRVAGDGREGIAYLEGLPPFQDRLSHPFPDLVILDLLMPEVDGFGVLEWLGQRKARAVPVVVLTGSPDPTHEGRAMALGATAFYRKPGDSEGLTGVVRKIVEEYLKDQTEGVSFLQPGDQTRRAGRPASTDRL